MTPPTVIQIRKRDGSQNAVVAGWLRSSHATADIFSREEPGRARQSHKLVAGGSSPAPATPRLSERAAEAPFGKPEHAVGRWAGPPA